MTQAPHRRAPDARAEVSILALYQFVHIDDPAALRSDLARLCERAALKGTLLVATEGLNGTVAGSDAAVSALCDFLARDGRFDALVVNRSRAPQPPFQRMKVKLRREIVSLGVTGIDPGADTGVHVPPAEWDALIADPEVVTIDTRNDYEVRVGTFENAISPGTVNFRDFPAYVARELDPARHRRVAMFCTGGIRCEKASAYLKQQGFAEVYQLEGGILSYLNAVPAARSSWRGECFVFDERVTVTHDLAPGGHVQCFACRRPLSEVDTASPDYVQGISCPYCVSETDAEHRARFAERRRQVELADRRGRRHIAADMPAERAATRARGHPETE